MAGFPVLADDGPMVQYAADDLTRLRQDIVFTATLRQHELIFHSTWGVFSPRAVDEGSLLLLDHLQINSGDNCLDMGCGYGPLGLALACEAPQGTTHLVDKDFVAVDYSRKNAEINHLDNVQVYLSNGFSHVGGDEQFNVIVSNLPAKAGKELFYLYFYDARARMIPGAAFYVVTINGLRQFIKRSFTEVFGNYKKLKQGKNYTVSVAYFQP